MAPPTKIELPSQSAVNKAGKVLRDLDRVKIGPIDYERVTHCRRVVQAFRDAHGYPMQLVRGGLVSFVHTTGVEGYVSQRHKRVPRIVRKLRRMRDGTSGGTGLARLEDIGGCRVVVATLDDLEKLHAHIHRVWGDDISRCRDYINLPEGDADDQVCHAQGPKAMGYRARHIVVQRDGMAIEIQLRTRGQQAWADAVEAADSRLKLNLKDEDGPEEMLEYFRTAGEMIYLQEAGIPADVEFHERWSAAREAVLDAGYYTR